MRGILINPYLCTIEEHEVTDDIQSIYDTLSHEEHRVSLMEIGACFSNSDNLIVDGEGLLRKGHAVFKLNGNPFVGCALILGANSRTGGWTDAMTSIEDIHSYVLWTTLLTLGMS